MNKLTKELVRSLARKTFDIPRKPYFNVVLEDNEMFKLWYTDKLGDRITMRFTSADLL